MRTLRVVFLGAILAAASLAAHAAEAAAPETAERTAARKSAKMVTGINIQIEVERIKTYAESVRTEVQITRTTLLVVMIGLAALILFVYGKVGMMERKLLKGR